MPLDRSRCAIPRTEGLATRFFRKVDFCGDRGCWLWRANKTQSGYGLFTVQNRPWIAHRVAYLLLIGPIEEGLELDHLCRNTTCVNPWHLQPVTPAENRLRAYDARGGLRCQHAEEEKGRTKKGKRYCRGCQRDYYHRKKAIKGNALLMKTTDKRPQATETKRPTGHAWAGLQPSWMSGPCAETRVAKPRRRKTKGQPAATTLAGGLHGGIS